MAPTLRAQEHGHQSCVIAFNGRQDPVSGPVTGALDTDGLTQCIAFTERGRDGGRSVEWQDELMYCLTNPGNGGRAPSRMVCQQIAPTIPARERGGGGLGTDFDCDGGLIISGYAVRRLTPLECERLQGLPDGWTNIPGASDTARYKAIGNGLAIVCPEWIFRRLNEVLYSDMPEAVNW